MVKKDTFPITVEGIAQIIGSERDTDVLICNAPIGRPLDQQLINLVSQRQRRKNVALILITRGGDPDVAYKMARCLQSHYEKFTVIASGVCKSAGTLIALGAHEVVMCPHSELGPLDMQMAKKDELIGRQSGLTIPNAMDALQSNAYASFELFFGRLIHNSNGAISTATASKIASDLAIGLFAPIYQQIDPMLVSEQSRANSVARHYGIRLVRKAGKVPEIAVEQLISLYPSHEFVIDEDEAQNLLGNVRRPNAEESCLLGLLADMAIVPAQNTIISYLNEQPVAAQSAEPAAVPEKSQPMAEHATAGDDGTVVAMAVKEKIKTAGDSHGHKHA